MCRRNDCGDGGEDDEDAVGWTGLLDAMHDLQSKQLFTASQAQEWLKGVPVSNESRGNSMKDSRVHIICLKMKIRSWDLMPPDIVRPWASTTLGTIISMAHRMGMTWKDLDPSKGRLRAEGLGQCFSGTMVRGMGIVMEYTKEPNLRPHDSPMLLWSLRIPSGEADKVSSMLSVEQILIYSM